jgi:hypothetical protein
MGAHAIFNNGQSTIDCQIRNISRKGAKLVLSEAVTLPEEFDLVVPSRGKTYRARLRWRTLSSTGVEFLATGASAELANRLDDLLAENALLRQRVAELTRQLAERGCELT